MATTLSGSSGGTVITTTTLTALVPPSPPQGRLTLTSATPVLTATVSAATTIYYALYTGNLIPIYSGTAWVMTTFTELSNATAQSSTGSAGPAVVANNLNYDLFAWSNSGTLTLSRGPPWTSDTVRGTGLGTTQISRVLGIWSNTVAITNGPGAGLGTYVGTVRSNGSATIDFIFGAIGANGTAAVLNVWNAYNRVTVEGLIGDSTNSWNYSTTTWRAANASNTMRASFVQGLQEESFAAEYVVVYTGNCGGFNQAGIGVDSTSAMSGRSTGSSDCYTAAVGPVFAKHAAQLLGFHYFQALEYAGASGTSTWYGDNGSASTFQCGLIYEGKF